MSKQKTESSRAPRPARARGKVLPDDACPSCGSMMRERRGALRLPVNGEEVSVPGMTYLGCPSCREVVLRYDEAGRLEAGSHEVYRKRHGLLSEDEIRSIRRRFGLRKADLARLLGLRADTISRWEAGRTVQTVTQDVLLRLLRDVPGNLEYLRRRVA